MCSYGLFNNFRFLFYFMFFIYLFTVYQGLKWGKMHLCQVKLTGNIMHSLKDNNVVCLFVCVFIYYKWLATYSNT